MTPKELFDESYYLLDTLIGEAYELKPPRDLDTVRSAFIYRHARNVMDIATDVRFLYVLKRYTAAQIAIRSMLESMFCVAAAAKLPGFAPEKTISEFETFADKVGKIDKVEWSEELAKTRDLLLSMAADLRKEFGVTTTNKWSVFDVARVGKLQHHYATDYMTLSSHVHVSTGAIIFQEKRSGVGDAYHSAVTALLLTAGHFAQLVETKDNQGHLDKATKLLLELSEESMQLEFRAIGSD